MKKLIQLLLILSTISFGDEYVIIANHNMQDLSSSKIKAIFLKKLTYIGNTKAVPVNLQASDNLRIKFEKEVLHMNFSRLKKYWTKQHYLGHRPPLNMKSQKSIKSFVKKVDGSIGYINIKNIDNDVKILYRWKD